MEEEKAEIAPDVDEAPVEEAEGKDEEAETKEKLENLTPEFIENLEDVFNTFKDGDEEKIEFGSLCKVLQWVGFNPTFSEMKEWAEQHDKNRTGKISLAKVKSICNQKIIDPDSIDQTIEALKLFDIHKEGKNEISELRWALTKLGDGMDEKDVDDMIAEMDKEKSGFVDIVAHAKYMHNVKEEKEEKKKAGGAKKK